VVCPTHGLIDIVSENYKTDGRYVTLGCGETVRYTPSMAPEPANIEAQMQSTVAPAPVPESEAPQAPAADPGAVPDLQPVVTTSEDANDG